LNDSPSKLNSSNNLFITRIENDLNYNKNNTRIINTYKSKPKIISIKYCRNFSNHQIYNNINDIKDIKPIKLFLNDYSKVKGKILNYHEKFNIPLEKNIFKKNTIIPKKYSNSNLIKLPKLNNNFTNRKKLQCNNSFIFIL
jgi:hypothetical protein